MSLISPTVPPCNAAEGRQPIQGFSTFQGKRADQILSPQKPKARLDLLTNTQSKVWHKRPSIPPDATNSTVVLVEPMSTYEHALNRVDGQMCVFLATVGRPKTRNISNV
eukprot:9481187-Pyramimonas_sp.AAC.2